MTQRTTSSPWAALSLCIRTVMATSPGAPYLEEMWETDELDDDLNTTHYQAGEIP